MGCHPQPIDELIFFKMVKSTNQIYISILSIWKPCVLNHVFSWEFRCPKWFLFAHSSPQKGFSDHFGWMIPCHHFGSENEGKNVCFGLSYFFNSQLPSGYVKIANWKITIEIVSFPMNSMVMFHSYVSLPEGSQKQEEQRGDDLQDHHLVIPSRMRKWLCLCDPQKNMGWPIPWGTTPKIFPTIHWDCRLDPHRSATDPSTFWSLCRWFDPSDLNQWWSNFLIIWIGNNYCVNRWVRLFRSFFVDWWNIFVKASCEKLICVRGDF